MEGYPGSLAPSEHLFVLGSIPCSQRLMGTSVLFPALPALFRSCGMLTVPARLTCALIREEHGAVGTQKKGPLNPTPE